LKLKEGWRKLHNKLYDLHSTPNVIREFKSRTVGSTGNAVCRGNTNEYRVGLLVKNLKDKPLGRRRSRWDDINMGLKDT